MIPAQAASRYYPISVSEFLEGDNPRIQKVYQLSLSDDPAGIPTEDFERDGRTYYLLDMTRKDEVGIDTKTHTQTVTLPSKTNNMEKILQQLEAELETTTEDGYTGILKLDHTSVQVKTDGYATKTRTVTATRTYPNLSDADLSFVPKTIQDNGRTLTLADVQWATTNLSEGEGVVQRYCATASYTGTASSKYATGYTVTANYTGEVAKTGCDVVTYTAIFGSRERPQASPEPTPTNTPDTPDHADDTEKGDADDAAAPAFSFSAFKRPLIIGGVTFVLVIGLVFAIKKIRNRR